MTDSELIALECEIRDELAAWKAYQDFQIALAPHEPGSENYAECRRLQGLWLDANSVVMRASVDGRFLAMIAEVRNLREEKGK